MNKKRIGIYTAPQLKQLAVSLERGFAASDENFEQPDFGGEDNL